MKNNKVVDLSIIVSNVNTKKNLELNLCSLYSFVDKISFEIIVVDDGSKDGSVEMLKEKFPTIKVIENKTNLGYSKSYNKGTREAKGRYILHLNSDVLLEKKVNFHKTISFLDKDKKVGILGCKIVKPDGTLDPPCKRSLPSLSNVFFQTIGLSYLFPKSKLFGNYYLSYLNENLSYEVYCLMGAFMLIRREVFNDIGFLDERFFIYGEDIDFCLRTKMAGWKIIYYPKITITHTHGGTTNKSWLKHLWLFHQAMFLYYNKHFAKRNSLLINILVYIGITIRFSLGIPLYPLAKSLNLFLSKLENHSSFIHNTYT